MLSDISVKKHIIKRLQQAQKIAEKGGLKNASAKVYYAGMSNRIENIVNELKNHAYLEKQVQDYRKSRRFKEL